jgi:hypothetical protein
VDAGQIWTDQTGRFLGRNAPPNEVQINDSPLGVQGEASLLRVKGVTTPLRVVLPTNTTYTVPNLRRCLHPSLYMAVTTPTDYPMI